MKWYVTVVKMKREVVEICATNENGAVFKALEGPDVYTVADVKRKDQVKRNLNEKYPREAVRGKVDGNNSLAGTKSTRRI